MDDLTRDSQNGGKSGLGNLIKDENSKRKTGDKAPKKATYIHVKSCLKTQINAYEKLS